MGELLTPDSLPRSAGYSHVAVIGPGKLVWTAGQVPADEDGSVPDGWQAQARLAFANVGKALEAGGATWTDVMRLMIYVTSIEGLSAVREVRDELVDTKNPPVSSLVCVAGLVGEEWLLEVEAVAAIPWRSRQPTATPR
jgi:enamine deaminase RidA (YjgF/YER057c/UK114 family)